MPGSQSLDPDLDGRLSAFLEQATSGRDTREEDWAWFLDATRRRLVLLAGAITGNDLDTAEDAFQELCVLILDGKVPYRPRPGAAFAFLVRVLVNRLRRRYRTRASRGKSLEAELEVGREPASPPDAAASITAPRIVGEVLGDLPLEARELLSLRYLARLPEAEIREILGMATSNIFDERLRLARRMFEEGVRRRGYHIRGPAGAGPR